MSRHPRRTGERARAGAAPCLSFTKVCPCASVGVREEYPLTPLRTRVVRRLVCWMTAMAWCVRVDDRVETMPVDYLVLGLGGVRF